MLQDTASRLDASVSLRNGRVLPPMVVSNEEYRFITAEQLRQSGHTNVSILLEPKGRNTAPALTLAALAATQTGDDPVLVVMPADHIIDDVQAFRVERLCKLFLNSGLDRHDAAILFSDKYAP